MVAPPAGVSTMKKEFFLAGCLFISFLIGPAAAGSTIDSLKRAITAAKNNTEKVTSLNDLAWEMSDRDPDTAIIISTQALHLAEKEKSEIGIAKTYHQLGTFHWLKGSYLISLDHYSKALAIWDRLERSVPASDRRSIIYNKGITLGNIGLVYMEQGNYAKALDHYFRSLKIAEKLDDKESIAIKLSNIGIVYLEQGDHGKALEYYLKALELDKEMGNKTQIGMTLGNIGIVYKEQEEYDKALDYFFKALDAAENDEDLDGIATWLGSIGDIYYKQGEKNKALDHYFKALKTAEEMGNRSLVAHQLSNIGLFYKDEKKYREAEEYLLRALALDDSTGSLYQVMNNEEHLSELYSTTGKHALALEHYKRYAAVRDSIFSEESTKRSVQAEMNYEFEKKQAVQKAEHEKEVIALEAENRIQKNTRNYIILIGLMLLVTVTLGLVYFTNRRRLRMKEQHSHQLILSQEKERQRISKELHDSIGQNILFIKNQLVKKNDTSLMTSVDETLEEVRNISKDLYPNQLEKYGLAAAIDGLAEKVNSSSGIFMSHDLEGLDKALPPDKQINYYRIIQECVSNTMKHADATALRITASAAAGGTCLVVQDNGKGFDRSILSKKAQRSFGLLNLEERVKYLRGKFELETAPGKGTKYIFHIPD